MTFGRPKAGQPTRHLFVGNCGPHVGIERDQLAHIFTQFGAAEIVIPEQQQIPRSAFIFVTYPRQEDATAAVEALDGRPCACADDRVFTVKYADLKQKQVTSTDLRVDHPCPRY